MESSSHNALVQRLELRAPYGKEPFFGRLSACLPELHVRLPA